MLAVHFTGCNIIVTLEISVSSHSNYSLWSVLYHVWHGLLVIIIPKFVNFDYRNEDRYKMRF